MPRILGVDLPQDKPTHISLRYIYGIGPTLALELCSKAGVNPQRRARELTDDDISRIATILDKDYTVEGPLRRQVHQNIAAAQRNRLLSRRSVIAAVCRFAASEPAPMLAPARVRARPWPARRA